MEDCPLLEVTPKIRDYICFASSLPGLDETYADELKIYNIKDTSKDGISFKVLKYAFEIVRNSTEFNDELPQQPHRYGQLYLHELLEGSSIYVKPCKPQEKSKELIDRLEKLKLQQQQQTYDEMVKDINPKKINDSMSELGGMVRTTSQQLSTVMNFIVSVIGCFAFAWFASQYTWNDIGARLIFSIIVASVVALAELYFLARAEL